MEDLTHQLYIFGTLPGSHEAAAPAPTRIPSFRAQIAAQLAASADTGAGARRPSPDVRAVLLASVLELASRLRADDLHARALHAAQLEEGAAAQRSATSTGAQRIELGRALKALGARSSAERTLGDSAPAARSRFALLDQLVYDKARFVCNSKGQLNTYTTIERLHIRVNECLRMRRSLPLAPNLVCRPNRSRVREAH